MELAPNPVNNVVAGGQGAAQWLSHQYTVLSTPLTTITLSPDSPSKSRNLEQTVSYPSLGREAVGPPPSPPPPPRCRTGLLPSGKYQTSAETAGCCEWTPRLPMPPSSPPPWLYSSLSSQVTPNNKLLWWAWLLQLSRVMSFLTIGVAPSLSLESYSLVPRPPYLGTKLYMSCSVSDTKSAV